MLYAAALITVFGLLAGVAVAIFLLMQVVGLFVCSWLLKKHLLLWYACLLALVFTLAVVSGILANFIIALELVALLVLPVIWLWNASRS